jgi:hypothetical protein
VCRHAPDDGVLKRRNALSRSTLEKEWCQLLVKIYIEKWHTVKVTLKRLILIYREIADYFETSHETFKHRACRKLSSIRPSARYRYTPTDFSCLIITTSNVQIFVKQFWKWHYHCNRSFKFGVCKMRRQVFFLFSSARWQDGWNIRDL